MAPPAPRHRRIRRLLTLAAASATGTGLLMLIPPAAYALAPPPSFLRAVANLLSDRNLKSDIVPVTWPAA